MPTRKDERLNLLAGLVACILPGLGYVVLGERLRAVYAAVGILGLFVGGLLVGGVDVVDHRASRYWFYVQAGVGPLTFAVDWYHQHELKGSDGVPFREAVPGQTIDGDGYIVQAPPGVPPPKVAALGKVFDVGSLFVAIAGMLNVIAIVDCLISAPPPSRRARERRGGAP